MNGIAIKEEQNRGWGGEILHHLFDVKVLTAAGGLFLAAFVIYLFAQVLSSKFDDISQIQREQNQINREFVKALESNTQVMHTFIRSIR